LQSIVTTLVLRRVDIRRLPDVKIIVESLSQHDEKHVVPTPLSGIRVGRRRRTVCNMLDNPPNAMSAILLVVFGNM
jgi:hypothetical protein